MRNKSEMGLVRTRGREGMEACVPRAKRQHMRLYVKGGKYSMGVFVEDKKA